MNFPWEQVRIRLPLQLGEAINYLTKRQVTKDDFLLAMHASETAWPELSEHSIDHLIRISALASAFNQLGAKIYEFQKHVKLEDILRLAGVNVDIAQTFPTVFEGWAPNIGGNALVAKLQESLSASGRLLIAGAYLWDNGSDVPCGCIGGLWKVLALERKLPAFILRDYCFQYGASMYTFRIDDLASLKPDKKYQGCI